MLALSAAYRLTNANATLRRMTAASTPTISRLPGNSRQRPPPHGHIRRIMVRNLSSGSIRFIVKLVELRPNEGPTLPVYFQPVFGEPHKEVEVHGGGEQPVDILVDRVPWLKLLLINSEPYEVALRTSCTAD